jgi:hypothetical protein
MAQEGVTGSGTPVVSLADGPVEPRKVLYKWTSAQRFFKPLDKKKFWIVVAATVVFMVVLAILGNYGFMLAIGALVFLVYVVGTIPPVDVENVITNNGIEVGNAKYGWEKLEYYWFSKRDDQIFLNVDTLISLPGRLMMIVTEEQMEYAHQALRNQLPYLDLRKQGRLNATINGEWVDMLVVEEGEGVADQKGTPRQAKEVRGKKDSVKQMDKKEPAKKETPKSGKS